MSTPIRTHIRETILDVYPGRTDLPPVFLLPGLFGGGWIWEPVALALSDAGYRVALPVDPLGRHPRVADPEQLAAAFGEVIAATFDQPAVIAGNSLGSLVALKLAAEHSLPVRGLVLSGSPGLGESIRPPAVGALRSFSKSLAHQQAAQLFYDQSLVTPELIDRCFEAWSEPKTKLAILRALRNTRNLDARHLFGLVQCPALLAWGAQDEISPPAAWAAASELFPAARFVAIAESGHSPMIERPEQTTTEILRFLNEMTSPIPDRFSMAV